MNPKQKSVTMWAMLMPQGEKPMYGILEQSEKHAWMVAAAITEKTKSRLITQGYRAVKGKFVWDEK